MKKVFLFTMAFMLLGLTAKAQTTHKLGDKFGGGVIISLSVNNGVESGLIVSTQDQGTTDWNAVSSLINKPSSHNVEGKAFSDWRLPTKDEVKLIVNLKDKINGSTGNYWTSTNGKGQVYVFDLGGKIATNPKGATNKVRAVRNF